MLSRNTIAFVSLALSLSLAPALAQNPPHMFEGLPVNAPARGHAPGPIPPELRPAATEQVVIPELTEVPLVLKDDLHSGATKVGSEVLFFVARDVYGPGHKLLLARDTPAIGHVTRSHQYRSFGSAGHLYLSIDYILAQDKTRIPLRDVVMQAAGAAQNGAATAWGFGLGLISGTIVSAIITGKDAQLHPGARFLVHTNADVATAAPLPNEEPDAAVSQEENEGYVYNHAIVTLKNGNIFFGMTRLVEGKVIVVNTIESRVFEREQVASITPAGEPSTELLPAKAEEITLSMRRTAQR